MSTQSIVREPTLNDVVALPEEAYSTPNSPPQNSTDLRFSFRRITMEDLETEEKLLKGKNDASLLVRIPWDDVLTSGSTLSPKLGDKETPHWREWWGWFTSERLPMSSTPPTGVIVLKDDEQCVDPWNVALDLQPPFYRKVFMQPPYVSGVPDTQREPKHLLG